MRLLPLQSSHNNMMLNDMVYGTSIQKYSSVSAAHSESVYNTSRPSSSLYSPSNQNTANKRLPPLRSAMNNYEQQQYQQQQQQTSVYEHSMTMNSKSSKHVLFDATEHHRAAVVDAARLRSMSPAPHLNRPFSASNLRRQSASNPRARSAKPPQLLEEAMVSTYCVIMSYKVSFIPLLVNQQHALS